MLAETGRSLGIQWLYGANTQDRLHALKSELEHMLGQCAQGTIADCRLIEVPESHTLCAHPHAAKIAAL